MPWNQPGNNDNGSKPNNSGRPERPSRGDTPPDLDDILKDAKDKFDSMFGGGGGSGNNNNNGGPASMSGKSIGTIVILLLGAWLIFGGFYTVKEGEEVVQLRFGKYLTTKGAGLNWRIPYPIDEIIKVNTNKVNTVEVGYRSVGDASRNKLDESLMLTKDENIVDLQFAVQYDIKDPTEFIFNVTGVELYNMAESVVREAAESAVREIIGRNTLDFAITEGREVIAAETQSLLQVILDRYDTGINIRSVEMQNAQPPEQVQEAFNDAVRAREDQERFKNEAEAYRNKVIPLARGRAARELEKAQAYKEQTIFKARGEAARFEQVLSEYAKAPDITRQRMYLDSMETVLSNSSKLLIDSQSSGNNNLLYLPLDKLMQSRNNNSANPNDTARAQQDNANASVEMNNRTNNRGGENRNSLRSSR